MVSPTTKATTATLQAGSALRAVPEVSRNVSTADCLYRIAALTAGIALLMTAV